jgi:phage pi2 protein 07
MIFLKRLKNEKKKMKNKILAFTVDIKKMLPSVKIQNGGWISPRKNKNSAK